MKIKNQFLKLTVILLTAGICFSGCALFLLGAGAAGGYAISKDEIEGMTDTSYDKIWKATKDVLRADGVTTLEDRTHGLIKGLVDSSDVEARLDQVTSKTVRLRLKARKTKGVFPDIKLAQSLYTKIIKKVG